MKNLILITAALTIGVVSGYIGGVASCRVVIMHADSVAKRVVARSDSVIRAHSNLVANLPHVTITTLPFEAQIVFWNRTSTLQYLMGKSLRHQPAHWYDTLNAMFPRDTTVMCRIQKGDTYPMRVQRGNQ